MPEDNTPERMQAIGYVWGRADGSGRPAGDSVAFGEHWVSYLAERKGRSREPIQAVYAQWRQAGVTDA